MRSILLHFEKQGLALSNEILFLMLQFNLLALCLRELRRELCDLVSQLVNGFLHVLHLFFSYFELPFVAVVLALEFGHLVRQVFQYLKGCLGCGSETG